MPCVYLALYGFRHLILCFEEEKAYQMKGLRIDCFDSKSGAFPAFPRPPELSLVPFSLRPAQTGCFLSSARKQLISSSPSSHFHKRKFPWPSVDLLFSVSPWITFLPKAFSACRWTVTKHSHITPQKGDLSRVLGSTGGTEPESCWRKCYGSSQREKHVLSRVILPSQ